MGWVWRLRAVFIFYRGRAASASAAVAVLLLAAGMRGACLPREKSAPLDEERFGDVHWYEASHSRETGHPGSWS